MNRGLVSLVPIFLAFLFGQRYPFKASPPPEESDSPAFNARRHPRERHNHDSPPIAIATTRIPGHGARVGAAQGNEENGPLRLPCANSVADLPPPAGVPPVAGRVWFGF